MIIKIEQMHLIMVKFIRKIPQCPGMEKFDVQKVWKMVFKANKN